MDDRDVHQSELIEVIGGTAQYLDGSSNTPAILFQNGGISRDCTWLLVLFLFPFTDNRWTKAPIETPFYPQMQD
jgi:hypothetical protein